MKSGVSGFSATCALIPVLLLVRSFRLFPAGLVLVDDDLALLGYLRSPGEPVISTDGF
jgi:hypothetical protein